MDAGWDQVCRSNDRLFPYNGAMTIRSIAAIVATAGGFLCLTTQPAAQNTPQNGALRVLVSNGMKGTMEELQPQCEKAAGRPLAIQFGSTASLKKRIETGASRRDVGRSELGIGIRAGAPKPDIRTPEALKKTLQETKSITYPQDGASRGSIEKMFERMGIAADVKPRIILAPGSGPATESVAAGRAAMVITLFSEIVPTHGVEILGPLPGEYQSDIRFGAATSATSGNAEAAKALIAFLSGPKAAPVLKAKGIEPR